MRNIGSSIGISMVQATLVRQSAMDFSRLSEHVTSGNPALSGALPRNISADSVMGLQILKAQVARQSAMQAYDYVFAWMALMVLGSMVTVSDVLASSANV